MWYLDNTSGEWSAPARLSPDAGSSSIRNMDLAVDSGGNSHVIWSFGSSGKTPGQLWYVEVPPGGPSGPPAVAQLTDNTNMGYCSAIRVGLSPSGEPRVAWDWSCDETSADRFPAQVYVAEKTGASWSAPAQLSDYTEFVSAQSLYPDLAVDADGRSRVVWQDGFAEGNVWCSENSSGDFVRKMVSGTIAGRYQLNPRIAVDPSGNSHVVWGALKTLFPYVTRVYYSCDSTGEWKTQDISADIESTWASPNLSVDYAGNPRVCWWMVDRVMYTDKTAGYWCVPFAVLQSSNTSISLHLPGIESDPFGGTHVYAGKGSSSAGILYYNRTVPPELTGLNPVFGTRGDTVEVSAFGGEFASEATLTLTGPEGSPSHVTLGPFPTSGSGKVLRAEIDLTGAPAGLYGAKVTNPDAMFVTLPHAFEVRYPAPELKGLTPTRGTRGSTTPVSATITGADLRDAEGGITAELRDGAETISADAGTLCWVSPTQVRCDFTIPASAPTGRWDLFFAHNDDGASDALLGAFEVCNPPPTVETLTPASGVTGTAATVSGMITATGGENATERGFRFRYASGAAGWTAWTEHGSFAEGQFSRTLAGLEPGAVYAFQAMALNSGGWSYGAVEYFTTPNAQTVTTNPATSVTATGAVLNGDLSATGGEDATERGFRFKKSGAAGYMSWSETGSFSAGGFSHALSGLEPDALYEYQAAARNSAGWAYGSTSTFRTRPGAPVGGDITWYLAEGSTAWGFSTRINIQNPNAKAVKARVTCMPAGGEPVSRDVSLPALSQTTITSDALAAMAGGEKDFSTRVESLDGSSPIAVDRTMWWGGLEGHSSVGVTSPAKTWYMPEGTTNWGFETWVVVQNPNPARAVCEFTYMIEGKPPRTVRHEVGANTRATFSMERDIGGEDASIMVASDLPVILERAVYRNNRRAGHCSTGVTSPAQDYYLAEGSSAWGFTTYMIVQNPNDSEVQVTLTYMTDNGAKTAAPFVMPARSRKTVRVNDSLPGRDFSTRVRGSKAIIAERSMFWNGGPDSGEACHDSIGMSAPASVFCLPDGDAHGDCETWTCVQNPNAEPVRVLVTYMSQSGTENVSFSDHIPANSRRSYNMGASGVKGRAAIMVESLSPGKRILCERSMYWNSRGAGTDTIGARSGE